MTLKHLWNGDLPLREAFWSHAIIFAALASLAATVAAYVLIAMGYSSLLALAVYLAPTPYIVATWIGVLRSADRYEGPDRWAGLARLISTVWAIAMILL